MVDGYGSHADHMAEVAEAADERQSQVEEALKEAFAEFIERRQVDVIVFSNVGVIYLANAILNHPIILKPLLAICNVAARAIERDLQIKNLNTYNPRLSQEEAAAIAGYIKPFLPVYLEIPAISRVDRVEFIDKEIRSLKGRWEKKILDALNRFGKKQFKKRKFIANNEEFEIDAASPPSGPIRIAIDIKRIEARRDIHKRCDEIVNKSVQLKQAYPKARFAAMIYYPFIDEQVNISHRLQGETIDAVSFASESEENIENSVRLLLSSLEWSE